MLSNDDNASVTTTTSTLLYGLQGRMSGLPFRDPASMSEVSSSSSTELNQFEEFFEFMQKTDKDIEKAFSEISTKKAILFIGATGDGKSALINYLAGANMLVSQGVKSKKVYIFPESPVNNIEVADGDNTDSMTDIPNYWIDMEQENSTVYWDCPGFGDTRKRKTGDNTSLTVSLEVAQAFYIPKLVEHYDQVKIMIVINAYDIFNSKLSGFKNILAQLEARFRNTESLIEGISMVITKMPISEDEFTMETLISSLENFYEKEFVGKGEASQQKAKILKALLTKDINGNVTRISFLNAPTRREVGKYFPQNDKISCIKTMLNLLPFSKVEATPAALGSVGEQDVIRYLNILNNRIKGELNKIKEIILQNVLVLQARIYDGIEDKIFSSIDLQEINVFLQEASKSRQSLRINLEDMSKFMDDNIFPSRESSLFLEEIKQFFNKFGINHDLTKMFSYFRFLKFFNDIHNASSSSELSSLDAMLESWKVVFRGIKENIEEKLKNLKEQEVVESEYHVKFENKLNEEHIVRGKIIKEEDDGIKIVETEQNADAEKIAKIEAEKKAREEAAARAAAEQRAREEAAARVAAEQRAREEAAARAAAEQRAREEAAARAAAEQRAREEANARAAAEQRAREEANARAAVEQRAREEANARLRAAEEQNRQFQEKQTKLKNLEQTKEAQDLMKKAWGGNREAQTSLGVLYHNNGFQEHATPWYQKAAIQGETAAISNLGVLYEHGLGGLPKDQAKALAHYQLASDRKSKFAEEHRASLYAQTTEAQDLEATKVKVQLKTKYKARPS